MLRVQLIGPSLAHSLGADLGSIPNPQLDVQFCQQALKPACVPTGFHPHTNASSLPGQFPVELLRRLGMPQSLLFQFSRFVIDIRNLLEARMVIASYDDHVGSFLRALVGCTTKVYPRPGSRHCHGIIYTHHHLHGN